MGSSWITLRNVFFRVVDISLFCISKAIMMIDLIVSADIECFIIWSIPFQKTKIIFYGNYIFKNDSLGHCKNLILTEWLNFNLCFLSNPSIPFRQFWTNSTQSITTELVSLIDPSYYFELESFHSSGSYWGCQNVAGKWKLVHWMAPCYLT